MKKTTLKVETLVGTFTRKTASPYKFAVVRSSERSDKVYRDSLVPGSDVYRGGVNGHWIKDKGFVVSYHGSEEAAIKAANGRSAYVSNDTVIGIFPVSV